MSSRLTAGKRLPRGSAVTPPPASARKAPRALPLMKKSPSTILSCCVKLESSSISSLLRVKPRDLCRLSRIRSQLDDLGRTEVPLSRPQRISTCPAVHSHQHQGGSMRQICKAATGLAWAGWTECFAASSLTISFCIGCGMPSCHSGGYPAVGLSSTCAHVQCYSDGGDRASSPALFRVEALSWLPRGL